MLVTTAVLQRSKPRPSRRIPPRAVSNTAASTTGFANTACGNQALFSNTTGFANAANGYQVLHSNTTGFQNTASGARALYSSTTGSRNIALGYRAGFYTTGSDNVDIGNEGVVAESATIRVGTAGTQTRAFISGIRGVTTGVANAIPVLVDGNGQLGTVSSSRRFKEEIADMGELTDRLLELRPVVFRYKPEVQAGERPLEYGLIAEEVAEVFPELVVYDEQGQPFTVKYHLLASMLLNELKRQGAEHASEIEELRDRLAAVEARARAEGAGVLRICAKVEAELVELETAEREAFLAELGADASGLARLIGEAYRLLELISYFTAGPKEVRAWTIRRGSKAPQAAAEIHTDFERGFIRAEVIPFDDYIACNGEVGAKERGKMRVEGKDYVVADGDVMHFRIAT